MKKKYQSMLAEASQKDIEQNVTLQGTLPVLELIAEMKVEIEAVSAQWGLKIMAALMEQEIGELCGKWGRQTCHRHGQQDGYVIYAGRKVPIMRPRARKKKGAEVPLKTYQAFQSSGRMQKAVARQLLRKVSTRDYAGAIDDCVEGYGIERSSVSREWKAATAAELEKLCQRPVPKDLAALLIDSKYFRKECMIVALGVDRQGNKHVLGLWHGATENSTAVKALLADLQERGLETEAALLVVLDGAKALHRAVKDVFGDLALIQRCRVHKLRNVMEHLPKEKRQQAVWRLRGAWAKSNADEALKALRQVAVWLDTISPSAARSLEEGLEETLTLQRLGINEDLRRTFSTTNMIESCFSRTTAWTNRVKRWRDAKMILRWGAAALIVAEKGFRRVRGHEHLSQLITALDNHTQKQLAHVKKAA